MGKENYKTELEKNGAIAFVPSGNSMWPILKNKKQSVIVVKKTERLKPMDVALYTRGEDVFVLHRVMEVTDFGYIMCGDSQTSLEKVEEDKIFGVLDGFYKKKEFISVKDEDYINSVNEWYGDKKRREKKIRRYYRILRIKNIPKAVIKKILKKNKTEK